MKRRVSFKTPGKAMKATKISLVVFVISAVCLVGLVAAYSYDYRSRILLNTYISGHRISGQSRANLNSYVNDLASSSKSNKIRLVKDDKSWEVSLSDMGWELDSTATTDQIYGYGHSGSVANKLFAGFRSLILNKIFIPVYKFNENAVNDWLSSINSEIGTPKKEGNVQVKGDDASIIEPTSGETINEFELKEAIVKRFELTGAGDIKVVLVKDEPIISADEARALQNKAKELVANNVELVGPEGSTTLTSKEQGYDIRLKKDLKKKKSFLVRQNDYGPTYVSFDAEKIKNFLSEESDVLNVNAIDARFSVTGGQTSIFRKSRDGKVIKIDEATDKIVKTLEGGGTTKIVLPYQDQPASISAQEASDIDKYGIKELIGTATTSFARSPENRVHNIQNGVQYISGALVKPGDEFSTLKQLGSIDASTGYLPELVIKENETIPEFGGGLCQVSTTLFRAAMNTGLKITERQNHSYRVSYYEPPVGMDATIYSPRPDFKFLNDTEAYILVQGHVDGTRITFDIYGTKDGRTSETSTPEIYDVTGPAPDIYIDDPSLAPGEVKQIDHAHPGSKASFTYTVSRDGKIINKQTFVSSYVPWAAKFLKGPDAPLDQNQGQ